MNRRQSAISGFCLLLLAACAAPKPPAHIAFTPPKRFVTVSNGGNGPTTYVDYGAREEIQVGTTTKPPPRSVPPGQRLAQLVVCKNVPSTLWEVTSAKAVQLHFYEPHDGGYFEVLYSRRKGRPASRDVMYALTTACPQSPS
jgi:hypothetical protein